MSYRINSLHTKELFMGSSLFIQGIQSQATPPRLGEANIVPEEETDPRGVHHASLPEQSKADANTSAVNIVSFAYQIASGMVR